MTKQKQNEIQRRWREKNKTDPLYIERAKQRSKNYRTKNKAILYELKNAPCADCGKSYPPYVMDFDHRPGTKKLFAIGQSLSAGTQAILREASKCDVVCSNCHRIRTFNRKEKGSIAQLDERHASNVKDRGSSPLGIANMDA